MERISLSTQKLLGQLNNIKRKEDTVTETCAKCKRELHFTVNQWRRECACGMKVIISKSKFEKAKAISNPGCWYCMDRGYIEYQSQENGNIYKFVARCTCPKGSKYAGMPKLSEAGNAPDSERVKAQNRVDWEKLLKDLADQKGVGHE